MKKRKITAKTSHTAATGKTAVSSGQASYAAYLKAHPYNKKQRAAAQKKKKAAAKAKRSVGKTKRTTQLARPGMPGGGWILGGNDQHDSCAAAAAANSLLACTGIRAPARDVLALHALAGPSITAVLAVLADTGLAGVPLTGAVWLEDGEPLAGPGLVLDLDLTAAQQYQRIWDAVPAASWGPHAAVLHHGTAITWGMAVPVTETFLDAQVTTAWRLRWGQVAGARQLCRPVAGQPAQRHSPARAGRGSREPGRLPDAARPGYPDCPDCLHLA